jgi:hypothetical protein
VIIVAIEAAFHLSDTKNKIEKNSESEGKWIAPLPSEVYCADGMTKFGMCLNLIHYNGII